MDAIDKLKKLLALALHNSNVEEARSAALQACKVIQDNNLTIGGETVTIPVKNWDAPNQAEIDSMMSALEHQTAGPSVDDANAPPVYKQEPGLKRATLEEGVESDTDAFAKRCVFAWRAIRRERAQLKKEIEAFERRGGIHRGI